MIRFKQFLEQDAVPPQPTQPSPGKATTADPDVIGRELNLGERDMDFGIGDHVTSFKPIPLGRTVLPAPVTLMVMDKVTDSANKPLRYKVKPIGDLLNQRKVITRSSRPVAQPPTTAFWMPAQRLHGIVMDPLSKPAGTPPVPGGGMGGLPF